MKQFNWEEFLDKNNKIAVHCKTEEEAKDFCKQMYEHGLKWDNSTNSYIERTNWHVLKEKTCYTNHGRYCDKDYYIENDCEILEWSDYMKKKFTKADLKDGMIVEQRNNDMYMVFGNKLISKVGFNRLETYDECLMDIQYHDNDYDVMKVFKVNQENVYWLEDIFKSENLELIWQRTETKHMTTEEMRQKLEELTGEKIKIEPSMEEMIGVIYKYCRKHRCSKCVIPSNEIGCNFFNYSSDEVKKAYDKVMEDE